MNGVQRGAENEVAALLVRLVNFVTEENRGYFLRAAQQVAIFMERDSTQPIRQLRAGLALTDR